MMIAWAISLYWTEYKRHDHSCPRNVILAHEVILHSYVQNIRKRDECPIQDEHKSAVLTACAFHAAFHTSQIPFS